MSDQIAVTVYFDYCCPFCYLGKLELERLETELNLDLDWRYYQIHPEYPDVGSPLSVALEPDLEKSAWKSIQFLLKQRQLGQIKRPSTISNTIKAQLATEYAKSQGLFREFQAAIYETYFREGKGIGTAEEVIRIGEKTGLSRKSVTKAFTNLDYLRKVKNDDQEARRSGVVGIPTIMVNGRLAMGAQSYKDLKYFINRWGAR